MEDLICIEKLERTDQICQGDLIILSNGNTVIQSKAFKIIKNSSNQTEVIFNRKKNLYFNLDLYLKGKSNIKDVRIVKFKNKTN